MAIFIKQSYEDDFQHLLLDLKDKYPRTLFKYEGIDDSQLDITQYSKSYFIKGKPVSDITIDQNANVQIKDVVNYKAEMHKGLDKLNSLYLIWKTAKKNWGTIYANKLIEEEVCKDINIQDSTNSYLSYCFAFDCYDLVTKGLPFITNKPSNPSKHADTLLRHAEQLIMAASRQIMGATAIPNVLVIYAGLLKNDIQNNNYYISTLYKDEKVFDQYLKQEFQKFIYTINQPIREGQCVTEDTEILTPNGFKKYNEVNVGDSIYTWKDGNLNIQNIDKVNIYDYDNEMHVYEGRSIIQVVTPNHKVLYKKFNSEKYLLKESNKIINLKTPIDIPISINNIDDDYNISDDDLKFLTFILTDGSIHKEKNKSSFLYWYKSDKRWGKKEFIELCENNNINFIENKKYSYFNGLNTNKDNTGYLIYSFRINVEDSKKYIDLLNSTRDMLPDFFTKLSKRQSQLVLNLWSKLDGFGDINKKNEKVKLQCDNFYIADQIQHICLRAGYGSRIYTRLIGYNKKETIYVGVYKRKNKTATKKYKMQYKGKVWCPSTLDGIVIYRKNGIVFISGNSPFTNITIFDSIYLEEMCKMYIVNNEYIDPIFTMYIQKKFIEFFIEFNKDDFFTFPILTVQFKIDENKNIEDIDFFDYICDANLKFANFNIFASESLTSLSSCCRLINNIEDILSAIKDENTNLIGGSSVKVGSFGVCTLNLPRIALISKGDKENFFERLKELAEDCFKINHCRRELILKMINDDQMLLYSYDFIKLQNQYSTLGINGIYEAVDFMGLDILTNEGQEFVIDILKCLEEITNEKIKKYEYKCNLEQIPAESTAIKFAKTDELLYKQNKYKLYSNQFIPLTNETQLLNRIKLQSLFEKYFSGGTILHVNLSEKIKSKELMKKLMTYVIKQGVQYHAINYFFSKCENDHITIHDGKKCPICGKKIINKYTRIVGFITPISSWQEERREEFKERIKYKNGQLEI